MLAQHYAEAAYALLAYSAELTCRTLRGKHTINATSKPASDPAIFLVTLSKTTHRIMRVLSTYSYRLWQYYTVCRLSTMRTQHRLFLRIVRNQHTARFAASTHWPTSKSFRIPETIPIQATDTLRYTYVYSQSHTHMISHVMLTQLYSETAYALPA